MQEIKSVEKAEAQTAEVRAQHTPGPWGLCGCMIVAGHGGIADTSGDGAGFLDGVSMHDEIVANGRLIAAAPEILDALKSVASNLRVFCPTGHRAAVEASLTAARAAITKAEGRAQ